MKKENSKQDIRVRCTYPHFSHGVNTKKFKTIVAENYRKLQGMPVVQAALLLRPSLVRAYWNKQHRNDENRALAVRLELTDVKFPEGDWKPIFIGQSAESRSLSEFTYEQLMEKVDGNRKIYVNQADREFAAEMQFSAAKLEEHSLRIAKDIERYLPLCRVSSQEPFQSAASDFRRIAENHISHARQFLNGIR